MAGGRTRWSSAVVHSFSFLWRSSFRLHKIMKTLLNQSNSCLKTRGLSSKGYNAVEDRHIAFVAKRYQNLTSKRVTSMVAAAIRKTILPSTVRQRLHINGIYARVPRNCISSSVQPRAIRLEWCP